MANYKAVRISRGSSGWGGPLVIQPTDQRNKVVSVTGGGIHPIARQIAEMTGAEAQFEIGFGLHRSQLLDGPVIGRLVQPGHQPAEYPSDPSRGRSACENFRPSLAIVHSGLTPAGPPQAARKTRSAPALQKRW